MKLSLLGFWDVRVAVFEKSQFHGFLAEVWQQRFMAKAACDTTVFGSKQAPPGWIGLQSMPWLQAQSRLACSCASEMPALGIHQPAAVGFGDGVVGVCGVDGVTGVDGVYRQEEKKVQKKMKRTSSSIVQTI